MREPNINVTYVTGTNPDHPLWEILHVIYKKMDGTLIDSLLLARTEDGSILRKTDIVLDHWEKITNEKDGHFLQSVFADRDGAVARQELTKPSE